MPQTIHYQNLISRKNKYVVQIITWFRVQFGIKHKYNQYGLVQFVVFEKFTSADLYQIAREKSCDYLLIIYMLKIWLAFSFYVSPLVTVPYRVLKCDVIKIKFLKLWDLSGYSERTMSTRPTYQKWAFRGKLSLRS